MPHRITGEPQLRTPDPEGPLKDKLREAELAQEIMGKAVELLKGIDLSSPDPQTQIPPMLMSQQYDAWLKRKRL